MVVQINPASRDVVVLPPTTGVEIVREGPQGIPGEKGDVGPRGPAGDLTAEVADLRYEKRLAVQAHEAKADPHPQYLTEAEGDARFVNASGDTMTGRLTVTASANDTLVVKGTGSGGPLMIDAAAGSMGSVVWWRAGSARWYMGMATADDSFRLYKYANGGTAGTALFFNSETGAVSINTPLTVPAPTAALQAAQVTAIDATTGRLAIGGIEMGDTGWRDAISLLGNGWTATQIRMRRVGASIHIWAIGLNKANATNDAFLLFGGSAGYRPDNINGLPLTGPGTTNTTNTVVDTYAWAGDRICLRRARIPTGETASVWITYTARDPWPISLPGTPAT